MPTLRSLLPRLQSFSRTVLLTLFLHPICLTAGAEIVINEVHYEAEDRLQQLEFVELYNSGIAAVNLGGWRFTDGVEFVFPNPFPLAPGEYVVVAEDPAELLATSGVVALGPFSGSLANEGERIELSDSSGAVRDSLEYRIEFPWPLDSSGQGSTMELMHPSLDNSLGSSWRASTNGGTPATLNSAFLANPPPQIESAAHSPQVPTASESVLLTAAVSDPDGVRSVTAVLQVVAPGDFIPAELSLSVPQLLANANQPRNPNPAFENPANWFDIPMRDDGLVPDAVAGDGIFSATVPPMGNRSLVRYRIRATDDTDSGSTSRAPYPDDPSLNFAYYVYDGMPPYTPTDQTVHPNGLGHSYSPEVLTSLPVYTLITRFSDVFQCMAWIQTYEIPSSNRAARSAFNWEGAFVYDGVVYDHIRYRLRGHNQRYQLNQKRNMRFRFNRGNYFQAHDQEGRPYPTKWRTMLFAKMYGPRNTGNFGLAESINNFLFNLVGVPAPFTHHIHFRVLDGPDETPFGAGGQYNGDFWGMFLAMEDYDSRFLDAHQMPKGNLYKLTDGQTAGLSQLRYQAEGAVAAAEDYNNIVANLHPAASLEWLEDHVDWEHWVRYETVQQAIRHYDLGVYPDRENSFPPVDTPALKNIAWFFRPDPGNPLGKLVPLPWDHEQSWGENGAHQGWDMPLYAVIDPQITDGRAKVDYTGGPRHKEKLYLQYRNFIREFRDLIWNEEVLPPLIERYAEVIQEFVPADRDRWKDHPFNNGELSDFGTLEDKVADMNVFAFVGGTHWPVADRPNTSRVDPGGRAEELDERSNYGGDAAAIPAKPTIAPKGDPEFPAHDLVFEASPFSDPQGPETFAAMKWRLAEITDPSAPAFDPEADPIYEWTEIWSSGELTPFTPQIQIPPSFVLPGRTYRVRCRMKDDTDRWGHWSDPIQFTVKLLPTHSAGDVIISEIYGNAPGNDDDQEWMELFNTTNEDIDIRGWRIVDNETDSHTISSPDPVIIPAKGHLVLGETLDSGLNDGAPVNYAFGNDVTLGNNADEVVLLSGETVIYSLGYGAFVPSPHAIGETLPSAPPEGAALGMGIDYCDGPVSIWVVQTSTFGSGGGFGTPGQANDGVALCSEDEEPPVLLDWGLGRSTLAVLAFDEPLNPAAALNETNYTVSPDLGTPTSATLFDPRTVVLEFAAGFEPDVDYTLDAVNLADAAQNVAAPISVELVYSIPQVSITEIMYNNRGTDIEWIELRNMTDQQLDLTGWYLTDDENYPAQGEGSSVLPQGAILAPGEYAVVNLWGDAHFDLWQMPANVRILNASRIVTGALANDGDNLGLYTSSLGGVLVEGGPSAIFADQSQDGDSIEKVEEFFPWTNPFSGRFNFARSTTPIGFETGLNENLEMLSSFASPGRASGTGPNDATPTPTATEAPTPTPTRDYDIAPVPSGDGDINAKDLLLFLDRIDEASEEARILFDFSRFWNR